MKTFFFFDANVDFFLYKSAVKNGMHMFSTSQINFIASKKKNWSIQMHFFGIFVLPIHFLFSSGTNWMYNQNRFIAIIALNSNFVSSEFNCALSIFSSHLSAFARSSQKCKNEMYECSNLPYAFCYVRIRDMHFGCLYDEKWNDCALSALKLNSNFFWFFSADEFKRIKHPQHC